MAARVAATRAFRRELRLACVAAVLAACAGAGFRPHKYLDKDADGKEHSDLRIIGGSKVSAGKFPWMVLLGGSLPRCGGAAIDENWVMTAAHCVLNAQETAIISASRNHRIYFGCENLGSSSCQSRYVTEIRANPCFDPCCDVGDIALLKVDRPFGLGNKLPPVDGISGEFGDKLEKAKAGSGSEIVTMMGWGSTCPSASASCAPHDLHELSVPVSTQAKCRQVNPINTHINSGHCGQKNRCKSLFDNDAHGHVYCAGGAMADLGNKDSCNGDSGSPVAWYDASTGRQMVVGVIILGSEEPSRDQRCGAVGRHSVVTQVNAYAYWITNTIQGIEVGCVEAPAVSPSAPPPADEKPADEKQPCTDCNGKKKGEEGFIVSGAPRGLGLSRMSYLLLLTASSLALLWH